MITRQHGFPRLWNVFPAYRDNLAGLVMTIDVNGTPISQPIARPGGMYQPNRAPLYLHGHTRNVGNANRLIAAPTPALNLPRVNKAMDPSDPQTWQRPYIFS